MTSLLPRVISMWNIKIPFELQFESLLDLVTNVSKRLTRLLFFLMNDNDFEYIKTELRINYKGF